MHFNPINRHILIEVLQDGGKEEDTPTILLPEDYKPSEKEYVLARVIDSATDCNEQFFEDDTIIVRQNMIEKVEVGKDTYDFILENYVLGVATEGEETFDEIDIN
mgnify:FL=1|tara:strand:- start:1615 stop:1929 length:315 start_codon:yes stop_codon:yes gene_type:complete